MMNWAPRALLLRSHFRLPCFNDRDKSGEKSQRKLFRYARYACIPDPHNARRHEAEGSAAQRRDDFKRRTRTHGLQEAEEGRWTSEDDEYVQRILHQRAFCSVLFGGA